MAHFSNRRSMLVVQDASLPGASFEATSVALNFESPLTLSGDEANRSTVLQAMSEHEVVHCLLSR